MNVYDFDKTIYPRDSSIQFYIFNLKRNLSLIRFWPLQAVSFVRHYVLHQISKTEMKENFYTYFKGIKDIHHMVELFWNQNEKNIFPWYLKQKKEDDLIISASPEFLLKPICDRLSITLIASDVDPKSGKTIGENCYGAEKVVRLNALYPEAEIQDFYSDSYSDSPLANLAKKSFLVVKGELAPW